MTTATCVKKTVVVATLRSRNLHDRANWVDKALPTLIDTASNASILDTLGIDLDTLPSDAWPDRVVTDPKSADLTGQPAMRGEPS